ncbi:hypothetical protein AB0N06_24440 [Streptomyces sp. NPDC051020]|uniref:hypothetical protein n=1 Tax=Streptomyces sp. NPDC051020 TaxID=3155409 RepID=UPI0034445EF4
MTGPGPRGTDPPPPLALGVLPTIRQDELGHRAGEITELDGAYREATGRRNDGGGLEVLHGRDTRSHTASSSFSRAPAPSCSA